MMKREYTPVPRIVKRQFRQVYILTKASAWQSRAQKNLHLSAMNEKISIEFRGFAIMILGLYIEDVVLLNLV